MSASHKAQPSATEVPPLSRVTANFRQYLLGWGVEARGGEGCEYFRSGIAQAQFNGVVRLGSLDAAAAAMAHARRRLAGVPWWWWVGPDSAPGTSSVLTGLGATPLGTVPIMARRLDLPAHPEPLPAGLRCEEVQGRGRLASVVRTYSASMGISAALEQQIVEAEARRPDNADIVRLAAVCDGQVVGTTVVILAHGVAGIFLVHVAQQHRRRGIGGALTAAALQAGRSRGMQWAALAASPAGEPLYRRFGFVGVSTYQLFEGPA